LTGIAINYAPPAGYTNTDAFLNHFASPFLAKRRNCFQSLVVSFLKPEFSASSINRCSESASEGLETFIRLTASRTTSLPV